MPLLKLKKKKGFRIPEKVSEPVFGDRPEYLTEYLDRIKEELGEPMVVDRLRGEMKKWREFNVVYPVGNGVFIHAYSPKNGGTGYNRYIIIEPPKPPSNLFRFLEELLAYQIDSDYLPRSSEEKKRILLYLFERVVAPTDKADYTKPLVKKGKLFVSKKDIDYLKYHLVREKVGVGILDPFLRDPYIEDISMSGLGNIFIVHKIFGPMESNAGFKDKEELDAYIIKLGEKIGKPISTARPVVDATLPDGSRINIVFGEDVSLRGSNFTIRRVAKTPLSLTQLIDWGTFDSRIAAYIWMMLNEGMSMFVCGETASGKTTSLNAISAFIKPNAKIVTIEDTAEVVLPHPNWTRELTRDTGRPESSVTMFDLLRAALRQRPNYIIVGEIRGAEGNIAFQAMQSVTWETPILIKKASEPPMLTTIGLITDSFFDEGEEGERKVNGYSVLSTTRTGELIWAPVRSVLRHWTGSVYRLEFEDGGLVRTTGSHSVFVLDEQTLTIIPKTVDSLKEGDILVRPTLANKRRGFFWRIFGTRIFSGRGSLAYGLDSLVVSDTVKDGVLEGWIRSLKKSKKSLKYPLELVSSLIRNYGVEVPSSMKYLESRIKKGKQKNIEAKTMRKLLRESYELTGSLRGQLGLEKAKRLLNADIYFVRLKSKKTEGYDGYVYDLSVPGTELFYGGTLPTALHNTGHPVMATFHAANLERLIQRLTNHPINVPKTNMDSLNLAWFQSAVYVKGFPARRVIEIDEIIGYDPASDAIAAMPVFTWDPVTDKFMFAGRGSSYLLEEKIAVMRGIPRGRIAEIYDELEKRRRYIQFLVDNKVFDYDRVFSAIIYATRVGIDKALKKVLNGEVKF